MNKVRIFTAKVGTSSYGKVDQVWFLKTIEDDNSRNIDSLTGWVSTDNSQNQFKLRFKTKEAAIKYATDKGYQYKIQEDKVTKIRKKSYADNFLKS